MVDRVKSEEVRVDNDLKSRRHDDLARRHSASDDVELRRRRRHRDVSASRTRQERATLGLRDKLDELRRQDGDRRTMRAHGDSVTSPGDVTMTRKDAVETSAVADVDNNDDEKPVCSMTSSVDEVMSSLTSRRYHAADDTRRDLSTPGIYHLINRHHRYRHAIVCRFNNINPFTTNPVNDLHYAVLV